MMQTEQNFDHPHVDRRQNEPAPAMTRTRCPGCKKLFAVETATLLAMSKAGVVRAEFTCTAELCHDSFAIPLPLPAGSSDLAVIPAVALVRTLSKMPDFVEKSDFDERALKKVALNAKSATELAANSAVKSSAMTKATLLERDCPRCGSANVETSRDCVRCGIVFENIRDERIEEEIALGGTRELAAMWQRVLEDYEDRIRHDKFVNECRDQNALSYGAKKYSLILIAAPQDDIARSMRNRIVALISVRAESSRLPIRLGFRIPKINSMALFGGSVLFFWGLAMPQLKNIMEIGLSLMLLAIGVRIALRARV